jgi:hypothetical protein
MPSLHCYRKEHKHFGLTHVREEQRCVDISVKVAVVVSVNLHHQRFDNFHKTLQKNAKWTEDVTLYVVLHCRFAPWGPPLKRVLHFSETKGGVSTAKWIVFGPAGVGHYEKFLH